MHPPCISLMEQVATDVVSSVSLGVPFGSVKNGMELSFKTLASRRTVKKAHPWIGLVGSVLAVLGGLRAGSTHWLWRSSAVGCTSAPAVDVGEQFLAPACDPPP